MGGLMVKNAGDPGLISGWGRFPGERNSCPLQYSYLENPTDIGVWWATVHGITKVRHDLGIEQSTYTYACPPTHMHIILSLKWSPNQEVNIQVSRWSISKPDCSVCTMYGQ